MMKSPFISTLFLSLLGPTFSFASTSFHHDLQRGPSLFQSLPERNSSHDLNFFLPEKMETVGNENQMAHQIVSHTVKNCLKELKEMKTNAARFAQSIDQTISPRFAFQKSPTPHSMHFAWLLWKQELTLKYKGWSYIHLFFNISKKVTCLEISEKLNKNLEASIEYKTHQYGQSNLLKMKYFF